MIQWYPGHMAKAKREIQEKLKFVDIVFELIDARIPYSSRNPMIKEILNNKHRLILLTKTTLSDSFMLKKWVSHFTEKGEKVLIIDSISGLNVNKIVNVSKEILKEKIENDQRKGLKPRPIRCMIVGIPNVGKSTLINKLVNKKATEVGNKPGVTKAQQWVRINQNLELLDTPGVLWPKFEEEKVAYNLAITGAIKDELLRIEDLVDYLLTFMKVNYSTMLINRYNININESNLQILEQIAKDRGLINNFDRVYEIVLNEFRTQKMGRVCLDII